MPILKKTSIQKILISTEGPNISLIARAYFDRFITLADMMSVAV